MSAEEAAGHDDVSDGGNPSADGHGSLPAGAGYGGDDGGGRTGLGGDGGVLIITGRGKGSGAEAVLSPAVRRMLSEELRPPVAVRSVPGNDGRLWVDGESLDRWLEGADCTDGRLKSDRGDLLSTAH